MSTPASTSNVGSDEESDGDEGESFASPRASSVGEASDLESNNEKELNNHRSVLEINDAESSRRD